MYQDRSAILLILAMILLLPGCGNNVSAEDVWQYYGSDKEDDSVHLSDIGNSLKDSAQETTDEFIDETGKAKKYVSEKVDEAEDAITSEDTKASLNQKKDELKEKTAETTKNLENGSKNVIDWVLSDLRGGWGSLKEALTTPTGLVDPHSSKNTTGEEHKDSITVKTDSNPKDNTDASDSKDTEYDNNETESYGKVPESIEIPPFNISQIGEYAGSTVVNVNNNEPYISDGDLTDKAFELYSPLDGLGRCQTAYANICKEIMPEDERGDIGTVKPTGWHQNKYDSIKEPDNPAGYLYNRCHLIAYSLAGENANPLNLITGTRHFNTLNGMESYEMAVLRYVKSTGNHVLYRVTPVFEGNNLLATGVLMEAKSVEDEAIRFCVFVYNIQPGIQIDYSTGENHEQE